MHLSFGTQHTNDSGFHSNSIPVSQTNGSGLLNNTIPVSQAPRQRKPLATKNTSNLVNPPTRPFGTVAPQRADFDNQTFGRQPNNSRNHDDNQVQCNCGLDAKLLTVRKEGPNTGG